MVLICSRNWVLSVFTPRNRHNEGVFFGVNAHPNRVESEALGSSLCYSPLRHLHLCSSGLRRRLPRNVLQGHRPPAATPSRSRAPKLFRTVLSRAPRAACSAAIPTARPRCCTPPLTLMCFGLCKHIAMRIHVSERMDHFRHRLITPHACMREGGGGGEHICHEPPDILRLHLFWVCKNGLFVAFVGSVGPHRVLKALVNSSWNCPDNQLRVSEALFDKQCI